MYAIRSYYGTELPGWPVLLPDTLAGQIALGAANSLAYSRPVGEIMMRDFAELNPHWMASVPRIWAA